MKVVNDRCHPLYSTKVPLLWSSCLFATLMKRNTLCGTGFISAQTEVYIDIFGRHIVSKNFNILLVYGAVIYSQGILAEM